MARMTPADFVRKTSSGESWCLLDVREPWEVAIASLSTAVKIPMSDIPGRMDELDRQQAVAVLCHAGIRSAQVAQWLIQQGFSSVANIEGGIDAWSVDLDSAIARY